MAMVQGFSTGFGSAEQHYENVVVNFDNDTDDNRPFKKMPVSYLQEICGRKKAVPIYELKASEGQVHEPTFVYVVTVEDLSGIGSGKNKKIAKHYAARDVLQRIVENDRFLEWQLPGETKEAALQHLEEVLVDLDSLPGAQAEPGRLPNAVLAEEVGDNALVPFEEGAESSAGAQNAIGKLYEVHAQRKWPAPEYDVIEESGPPHDKTFVVKVTLGNFEKIGTARTKRLAKRYAAETMLRFLNEIPLEERDKDLAIEDDEENAEENAENAEVPNGDLDADLSNLIPDKVTIEDAKCQFTFDFNAFGGSQKPTAATANSGAQNGAENSGDPFWEQLSQVNSDSKPCETHKKLLQDIADYRKWTVTYENLERKSKQGQFQCIVEFEGNGEAQACFGHGETKEEAEMRAALEALELLKILAAASPK